MTENQNSPNPGEAVAKLFGGILTEGKLVADEVTDNAKAVARSALGKLDVVSRDEFDAQSIVLSRTRARIEQLEAEIADLTAQIESLENR